MTPTTPARTASITRTTRETDITISLNLDGTGKYHIDTGVPFLTHMLELFSRHSLIDLNVTCKGDIDVDYHHTTEDIGLVLGKCLNEALGDRKGICRYGFFMLPMDETRADVSIDLGGRPYLVWNIDNAERRILEFDVQLLEEFARAFCVEARMNLHVNQVYGREVHHAYEAVFKSMARALRMAVEADPRDKELPSSKGAI